MPILCDHASGLKYSGCTAQEGELTLKLLNLFLDALTKFPALEGVLVPLFHELITKTLAQLHSATAKEGYLDLLLALFRAISVRPTIPADTFVSRLDKLWLLILHYLLVLGTEDVSLHSCILSQAPSLNGVNLDLLNKHRPGISSIQGMEYNGNWQ